jgi:hypothetical protein
VRYAPRGSSLRSKSNAGGNRARGRQTRARGISLDSLTPLTRHLDTAARGRNLKVVPPALALQVDAAII